MRSTHINSRENATKVVCIATIADISKGKRTVCTAINNGVPLRNLFSRRSMNNSSRIVIIRVANKRPYGRKKNITRKVGEKENDSMEIIYGEIFLDMMH